MPDGSFVSIVDIKQLVVEPGHSMINRDTGEFDWVFYQRGVMISLMLAEGVKVAQEHFGAKVVNAEQLRWGLENLKLDEARLKELGAEGMIPPFSTSCSNHTGHAGGWMLEWDGAKFVKASDLLQADRAAIDPIAEKASKEYADANQPWPVNSECK